MKPASALKLAGERWGEICLPPSAADHPVAECVRQAVRTYLHSLAGHEVYNLHDLLIREVERPLLEAVLEHTKGNQTRAARCLGLSRSTLRKKIALYTIDEDEYP